ncbi:ABC transporter permease [Caldimonas thermodepolymerans]|jgi:ABC-type dipeptide/oligopeptide/nickel transport systems, permease components|uniref:ABC transporter permease n=2 Tax=Caldimonas thermodepolymerans TaxID=215580 RepID=A0A2S5T7X6_9BURK|nr:ABC transporter permease [Caldimonas thermodepolymerans]PPE71104.1 ABC transporter permease [Caldimonas thermodepolymerans]QPC31407.1 ABC transporter permease [Caldimonas thermodepolymerans]UZG47820.1 ABC transporter permease [Caldimonas thermodepolymerans]
MRSLHRVASVLRRTLLLALPTMLGVVVLSFLLLQLAPGDAADVLAGESGAATEETVAALRERFGLNAPLLVQLKQYLLNLAQFSLGDSPRYGMPVADLIAQRLPGTLLLMGVALAIALSLGLLLGAVMATYVGRWPDRVLSVLALVFYSVPSFWIGLMLIVCFSIQLGWLPSGGAETIGAGLAGWDAVVDRVRHMVLPALSLALFFVAIYARLTRAAMLEVRSQDFVRTAAAKGLAPWRITVHHVLRNALLPVTTMAGVHLANILGGAVVVETVYSWPGLGRLAFEAVMGRDFNVLLGVLVLSSLLVIVANMLVDLLHAWLDPRIDAAH